jgi:zinc transporter
MSLTSIQPICAFDINCDGLAAPAADKQCWPAAGDQISYRWIHLDLADPAVNDWVRHQLPDIAASALLQSETRPRCDALGDGMILNLRGVNLNPKASPEDMVSLRLWVTRSCIISARIRKVWAIDTIREGALSGKAPATVGAFLAELTHGLSKRIEAVSLELEDQTDNLEEVALDRSKVPPETVAALRQTVIKMRRFLNPQREALDALANWSGPLIEENTLVLIRETCNRSRRSVEALYATRERLAVIQDHIDAGYAQALTRNGYLLSVVAAIFLPLGFLMGLFGVNIGGMPGIDAPHAFWILSVASVVTGIGLYLVFKLSKWL